MEPNIIALSYEIFKVRTVHQGILHDLPKLVLLHMCARNDIFGVL